MTLNIRFHSETIIFDFDPYSMIQSLVDYLAQKYQVEANRIHLVFRGKVLQNEYTFNFYGIKDHDSLFMAIQKSQPESYQSPKLLLNKLISKINKLELLDYDDFQKAYHEIHELAEHPILKNYAARNPDIKRSIADSLNYAESIEKPLSPSTIMFIAQNQDLAFSQMEGSSDGYRGLTAEYLEKIFEQEDNNDAYYLSFENSEDELQESNFDEMLNQFSFSNDDEVCGFSFNSKFNSGNSHSPEQTKIDFTPSINSEPLPFPNKREPFHFESSFIFNDGETRIQVLHNTSTAGFGYIVSPIRYEKLDIENDIEVKISLTYDHWIDNEYNQRCRVSLYDIDKKQIIYQDEFSLLLKSFNANDNDNQVYTEIKFKAPQKCERCILSVVPSYDSNQVDGCLEIIQ